MNVQGGRGKHKPSRDGGHLSGIEPLLDTPLRLDHPDSERQLDLRILPQSGSIKVPTLT